MATLDDLIRENLQGLLKDGPQGYEDRLFNSAKEDIGRQQQGLLETLFGRGMGQSTMGGDVARQVAQALAKARVDASTASRQATLAALAQASGQQNRTQQESQYQRTLDFNKKNAADQNATANRGLVAQGVAGLGGGALTLGGLLYGKDIKSGLANLFKGGGTPDTSLQNGPEGTYSGPNFGVGPDAVLSPDVAAGANFDTSIPDLNLDIPQYDLSNAMDPSNFNLDVPGFDLSSLFRPDLPDLTGGF